MIESITGALVKKDPTHVVISVQGIGYGVNVSLRTCELLPELKATVTLTTYLNVKEDLLELYGFLNELEKSIFLKLISVSGVGPKVAIRMLSVVKPEELMKIISEGNVKSLTALKGIGKKTAEVMIATLRTPMTKIMERNGTPTTAETTQNQQESDAVLALVALGVKEKSAVMAVEKAKKALKNQADSAELISTALKMV